MPIKNYTTEVPAMKSINEIQANLVKHGASAIIVNYGTDKEPESLSFVIPTKQGTYPYRLPANVNKVATVLLNMRRRPPEKWQRDYERVMKHIKEQATRVAWRIIKDWIDSQLAIIETEMVTVEQVFLPYMLMQGGEHTFYESMADRGFLLSEGQG